jgi:hypothetical protein
MNSKLSRYDQSDPVQAAFKRRVLSITDKITEISDVIAQRKAVVVTFRNTDSWYVFK